MTPDLNQLAVELLLTGFMSLLALGILVCCLSFLVLKRRRRTASEDLHRLAPPSLGLVAAAYQPSIFEQHCRWLVVKSSNLGAVQAALGLHNPTPCSWEDGLSRLAERKLFVSPPVRGWILVAGLGLPDPVEDVDRCYHFVVRLSRALGQVQFFSVHRALNHHGWIHAERGRIRRGYVWAGETLWNQGPPSRAERDLGIKCQDYCQASPEFEPLAGSNQPSNAEKVPLLAARWSFDPARMDQRALGVGLGVAGDLSHSRRE